MINVSLEVTNWCQHTHRKITFAPGVNGLVGPNGVGKSNLLAALYTGLSGKVPYGNLNDWVQDGHKLARIVQEVRTPTAVEPYRIERTIGSTTSARLTGNGLDVRGISKVAAALTELFGPTSNYGFVFQGTTEDLIKAEDASRLGAMTKMIPTLQKCENTRAALLTEINSLPVIGAVTEGRKAELQSDLVGLQARHAQIIEDAAKLDPPPEHEEYKREQAALQQSIDSLTERARLTELLKQEVPITQRLSDELAAVRGAYNEVQFPETLAQLLATQKECTQAIDEITAYRAAVQQKTVLAGPCEESAAAYTAAQAQLTALEVQRADQVKLQTEWTSAQSAVAVHIQNCQKRIELARKGVCPECERAFDEPEAWLASLQADLTTQTEAHARGTAALAQIAAQLRETDTQSAAARKNVEAARQEWQTLKMQLDTLQATLDTEVGATGDPAKLTQELAEATAKIAQLSQASTGAEAVKTKEAECTAQQVKVQGLQAQLRDVAPPERGGTVPAEELDVGTLTAELTKVTLMLRAIDENIVKQTSLVTTATEIATYSIPDKERQLQRLEAEESAYANAAAYTKLLHAARDLLHRDNLPKNVLAHYAQEVQLRCNQYLEWFGSPFSVEISQDTFEILCTMPTGYRCPAKRLSGGQASVMGTVFHFAAAATFSKGLGLVILDEPTAHMDEDAISGISELLSEAITAVSKNTGMQVVVVTHARELANAFNSVISLEL